MMALLELPAELIWIIIECVQDHKNLLCNLCLTCHVLRAQAIVFLYSKIDITLPAQFTALVKTISNNPSLGALIKSLVSLFINTNFDPQNGWVQNIVNLKHLTILSTNDMEAPLSHYPFQLESLEVTVYYNFTHLKRILENQPTLKVLRLHPFAARGAVSVSLSPLVGPNLIIFQGDIYAACKILPGRHVRRFEWIYSENESGRVNMNSMLREMTISLAGLRSLTYRSAFKWVHRLYKMSGYLSSLRFLEIRIMFPEDRAAIDWVAIATLPQLRILLVLELSHISKSIEILEEPDSIVQLFSSCSRLQYVDVGVRDWKATSISGCHRWIRGAGNPTQIHLSVALRGREKFLEDGEGDEEVAA